RHSRLASTVVAGGETSLYIYRIIPNKWAFAYVSLGPAAFFGSQVSYMAYCVQLHALFYMFLSYPLSFGFRYHVLIRPMPRIRDCVLLCFALWLIAFAQHILFIFSETDADFIREYLSVNKPEYNLTDFVVSGNHMIESPLTVITLASIVLPMFPIYVLVIYFYKKVHGYLALNTRNMREGTVKGHKRLMQALIIQASLPLLFIFPPITIYGLYHLEFINFTIIEYLVYVLFSFYPAASPVVTLYFVKPFNLAVRRLLGIPIKTKVRGMTPLINANKPVYYDEQAGSFSSDYFL
ncbi:7TM chemoreceptor, partial [Ancylostoma caninum]